jgi:hypothetical protein
MNRIKCFFQGHIYKLEDYFTYRCNQYPGYAKSEKILRDKCVCCGKDRETSFGVLPKAYTVR